MYDLLLVLCFRFQPLMLFMVSNVLEKIYMQYVVMCSLFNPYPLYKQLNLQSNQNAVASQTLGDILPPHCSLHIGAPGYFLCPPWISFEICLFMKAFGLLAQLADSVLCWSLFRYYIFVGNILLLYRFLTMFKIGV